MDQLRRSLAAGVLMLALAGCGGTSQSAWRDTFDSPDALADAALAALAAGDAPALARLALSEDELRTTIWPQLPASRPEVGMDWGYFWRDHAQRSTGFLQMTLAVHSGRAYELAAVSFDGASTYGDVTIHRAPTLDVHTAAGLQRMRLFGSMAERDGRWKLYSFVVD